MLFYYTTLWKGYGRKVVFAGAQGGRGKGSEGKVLKEEKVLKIDRPFRAGGFLSCAPVRRV